MKDEEEFWDESDVDLSNDDDPDVVKLKKKRRRKFRKRRLREVRKALLGNLVLNEDDRLTPGGTFRVTLWGAPDGAFGTILLGISERKVRYEFKGSHTQAIYQASKAMKNIGRGIAFETVPNGSACLLKHIFFRPVVIVFEPFPEEECMVLRAYCGRDILTFSSVRRAIKLFEEQKPRGLERKEKQKDAEASTEGAKNIIKGFTDRIKEGGSIWKKRDQ